MFALMSLLAVVALLGYLGVVLLKLRELDGTKQETARPKSYFNAEHAKDGVGICKKRLEAKRWLKYGQRPFLGKLRHRTELTYANQLRRLSCTECMGDGNVQE